MPSLAGRCNALVRNTARQARGSLARVGTAVTTSRSETARPRRAAQLAGDLRAIWIDGLAWAVMVGMGEQSIPAFAVAAGLPGVWAGLVATVPMVVGALLQLVSPAAIARLRSHKRWVVWNAALQAASFAPLIVAGLVGAVPGWLLYAVASVYWGAAIATNPAWSTWVGTLVPSAVRIRYFARRTRWLYVFQITALVGAGWILQVGSDWDAPLRAFSLVFLFALAARVISTACLARQSEPEPMPKGLRNVPLRELAVRLRHGPDGRLLAYMLSVQLATHVAAPFYLPYMLRVLEFSYAQSLGLFAVAVLAKAAALPLHARIAERRGIRALLWIGGLGLAPSIGIWMLTDDFVLLLLAQLFSGFVWSAYELSTFLLFFEAIRPEERTSVLTKYHLANALAITAGSLLGGALLTWAGSGANAFVLLFALSTILRLCTLALLGRVAPRPSFAVLS